MLSLSHPLKWHHKKAPLNSILLTQRPVIPFPLAHAAFERGLVDSGTCVQGEATSEGSIKVISPWKGSAVSAGGLDVANTAQSGTIAHCLPSLLCIGMAKAGTDELQGWLRTHPNVSVSSVRETQYFNHLLPRAAGFSGPIDRPAELVREMALHWPQYASFFRVPLRRVGETLAFEKTPGYARVQHNSSRQALGIEQHVPWLMRRLLPSARLVVILRDPAEIVRSRYSHCLRQMRRRKSNTRGRCGGVSEDDFEGMLVDAGVALRHEGPASWSGRVGAPNVSLSAAGLTAHRVHAARMAPGSVHLVEDYLLVLHAWSAAYPRNALLVIFTETLASDSIRVMNRVLRHAGLRDYHWPRAERVRNGSRLTYSALRSKSVSPRKTPVSAALQQALRAIFTPVIRRFNAALPCLHAPWPQHSGNSTGRTPDIAPGQLHSTSREDNLRALRVDLLVGRSNAAFDSARGDAAGSMARNASLARNASVLDASDALGAAFGPRVAAVSAGRSSAPPRRLETADRAGSLEAHERSGGQATRRAPLHSAAAWMRFRKNSHIGSYLPDQYIGGLRATFCPP